MLSVRIKAHTGLKIHESEIRDADRALSQKEPPGPLDHLMLRDFLLFGRSGVVHARRRLSSILR